MYHWVNYSASFWWFDTNLAVLHLRLGNRLLQIHSCNREPIHDWYREQYGPEYSRAITDAQLDYIEQSYDDLGAEATEIEL